MSPIRAIFLFLFPIVTISKHHQVGMMQFSDQVPRFVLNLKLRAQYEFEKILQNDTIPLKTRKAEMENWAEKYNLTKNMDEYLEQLTNQRDSFNKNVIEIISRLTEVESKIENITSDESISLQQQRAAVSELNEDYEPELSTILYIRKLVDHDDNLLSN